MTNGLNLAFVLKAGKQIERFLEYFCVFGICSSCFQLHFLLCFCSAIDDSHSKYLFTNIK